MEGIFLEYENENELRFYPFAAGSVFPDDEDLVIPPGVFVDASLYPVNPSGNLYLSEISDRGVFSVSDDTGVIMTGEQKGSMVDFRDLSGMDRHVGVLLASSEEALSEVAYRGTTRSYSPANTSFAASCVFPVVIDGVVSLDVGGTGMVSREVAFSNGPRDDIRVSSKRMPGIRRNSLRFDVLPRPGVKDDMSIKRIICVVDGKTPFRISHMYNPNHPEMGGYNVVRLSLDGIDKDVVCAAVHRENQFEMSDTCSCQPGPLPEKEDIPEAYQLVEVYIPPDEEDGQPEGGLPDGADNAFCLVVSNEIGEDAGNPLSITLEDGVVTPKTDSLKVNANGSSVEVAEEEFLDSVTSKGVVIQVPGLNGGQA